MAARDAHPLKEKTIRPSNTVEALAGAGTARVRADWRPVLHPNECMRARPPRALPAPVAGARAQEAGKAASLAAVWGSHRNVRGNVLLSFRGRERQNEPARLLARTSSSAPPPPRSLSFLPVLAAGPTLVPYALTCQSLSAANARFTSAVQRYSGAVAVPAHGYHVFVGRVCGGEAYGGGHAQRPGCRTPCTSSDGPRWAPRTLKGFRKS